MKALVKTAAGVGHLEVLDLPEPTPAADQLVIEVVAGAICGTDLHIHDDEYPNNPPFVLGHEMSGVVREVGSDVTRFQVGDRVSSETFKYTCGTCRYCQDGLISLCVERRSMGVHVDGAFAKYVCQREASVHALPDNVDFEAGSMCEPAAVAVRAVYERGTVSAGDVVVAASVIHELMVATVGDGAHHSFGQVAQWMRTKLTARTYKSDTVGECCGLRVVAHHPDIVGANDPHPSSRIGGPR